MFVGWNKCVKIITREDIARDFAREVKEESPGSCVWLPIFLQGGAGLVFQRRNIEIKVGVERRYCVLLRNYC